MSKTLLIAIDLENTLSLFGLRKSGKTSIIYAIERSFQSNGMNFISFDCELPSIHKRQWNELLYKLVIEYSKIKKFGKKVSDASSYDDKNAAELFEKDV